MYVLYVRTAYRQQSKSDSGSCFKSHISHRSRAISFKKEEGKKTPIIMPRQRSALLCILQASHLFANRNTPVIFVKGLCSNASQHATKSNLEGETYELDVHATSFSFIFDSNY